MVDLTAGEAVELFLSDGKPAGVWFCSGCHIVARTQAEAQRCCNTPCTLCGKRLDDKRRTAHPECIEARRTAREADQRAKAEVVTDYDGWVYCEGWGKDGYLSSLDELLDEIADDGAEKDRPSYAWACKEQPFNKLDAEECFERVTDDSFEGAYDQLSGMDELRAAVDAFNAANVGLISYVPDYSRVVLVAEATNA